MHFRPFITLAAAAAIACSCSDKAAAPESDGVQQVCISASAHTRTFLEEDGRTTRWMPGDRIALWACSSAGFVLTAEPFSLWHYGEGFPTAFFTAGIDPLPAGTYTYYAAYPVPASVSGSSVAYDLPAVQSGSADASCAVMLARPVEGAALEAGRNPDFGLSFIHRTHILKITVPESKNLLGAPVERLEIDFPTPVAGRLTLDAARPDAAPVLSDGGTSTLTLDFPLPVDAGDTFWAVIAPGDMSGGQIVFRAYSASARSAAISTPGKEFLPGHTTPVRLTIPAAEPSGSEKR